MPAQQLALGHSAHAVAYQYSTATHNRLNFTVCKVKQSKVYVDLYSAFLRKAPQMRSDMYHTVLPANYTMPAFTPQPQNITVLWLVLILPSPGG